MNDYSFEDLARTVRRHWWIICLAALCAGVIGGARTHFLIPVEWSSNTTLLFERDPSGPLQAFTALIAGGNQQGGGVGATFYAILKSRRIQQAVAKRMNLPEVLELADVEAAGRYISSRYEVRGQASGMLIIAATWESPPSASGTPEEGREAARLAADLANNLAVELGEYLQEASYTRAGQEREFLARQLAQTEQELLAAEDALVAYATEHELINPTKQEGAMLERLADLRQREANATIDLQSAHKLEAEALARLDSQQYLALSSTAEQRSPQIEALQRRILELQRALAEQTEVEGKSAEHPDVRRLQTQIEEAQGQMTDELSRGMAVNSRQYSVDPNYRQLMDTALSKQLQRTELEARLSAIRAEKFMAVGDLATLPSMSMQYQHLTRQVGIKSDTYKMLSEKYEAARVAEAASLDHFTVLDIAVPARAPSSSPLKRNVMLPGAVGALLGLLAAFWLEGRRRPDEDAGPA